MSATYRVMLDGVASGRDPDEVAAHLARILNAAPDTVRALVGSRGVVIRDGLDRDAAMRCRAVLERAGCIAVVNREIAATRPAGSDTPPANDSPGARKAYYAIGIAVAVLIGLIVVRPW
jgi:hypothetical protein